MDEKEVVPALLRVLKSIFQGDHVYLKPKLRNTECIVHIKRRISLAEVCSTCKHRATFLENNEFFIALAFSILRV